MARSMKTSRRSDQVANLTAQVEALQARLEKLERPAPSPNGGGDGHGHDGGRRRRGDLLKVGATAAAAGCMIRDAVAAAATNGLPIDLGNATTNDAGTMPTTFPAAATTTAP